MCGRWNINFGQSLHIIHLDGFEEDRFQCVITILCQVFDNMDFGMIFFFEETTH